MSNTYDVSDKPRLTVTFTVDSVNTDPTAGALIVKKPDATIESYLTSTGFASQGAWNALTNTPTLANGTGTTGYYYTVSVAGSQDFGDGSLTFTTDDYVAYDGESWILISDPQTGTLTKSATGVYYYDLPIHQEGEFSYRFEGYGTVHAAGEEKIFIRDSNIR